MAQIDDDTAYPVVTTLDNTDLVTVLDNGVLKKIAVSDLAALVGGVDTAADVPITDAGGYFTGTEVETALQELGAASGTSALPELYAPGRYYGPVGTGLSTSVITTDSARISPVVIWEEISFTELGIEVTTAAAAGGTAVLGIYGPAVEPLGAPIIVQDSVDTTTTGFKKIDIAETLQPGVYWLAVLPKAQNVTVRVVSNPLTGWMTAPDTGGGTSQFGSFTFSNTGATLAATVQATSFLTSSLCVRAQLKVDPT